MSLLSRVIAGAAGMPWLPERNVVTFGARGDGLTADGPSFSAAAAASLGGVAVPPGTYALAGVMPTRDIMWSLDPGAVLGGQTGLAGSMVRPHRITRTSTFGWGDAATAFGIHINTGGEPQAEVNGGVGRFGGVDFASYFSRDSAVALFGQALGSEHRQQDGATTFTATTAILPAPIDPAWLRKGMFVWVDSSPRVIGVLQSWNTAGSVLTVDGWWSFGNTTPLTPANGSLVVVNACDKVWWANANVILRAAQRPWTRKGCGFELGINQDFSYDPATGDGLTWGFDAVNLSPSNHRAGAAFTGRGRFWTGAWFQGIENAAIWVVDDLNYNPIGLLHQARSGSVIRAVRPNVSPNANTVYFDVPNTDAERGGVRLGGGALGGWVAMHSGVTAREARLSATATVAGAQIVEMKIDGANAARVVGPSDGSAPATYMETRLAGNVGLFAQGAASNVNLALDGKGTGGVQIGTSGTSRLSFFGGGTQARQTVTGARTGDPALASLLTALGAYGFITDSTTAANISFVEAAAGLSVIARTTIGGANAWQVVGPSDGSAPVTRAEIRLAGNVAMLAEGAASNINLALGGKGTGGTQIETSAGGRLSFFGAGTQARQTLPAAATDLASVITLANSLRSGAQTYGLFG